MIVRLQANSSLGSRLSTKTRDSLSISKTREKQWNPFRSIDDSFIIKNVKKEIKAPKEKLSSLDNTHHHQPFLSDHPVNDNSDYLIDELDAKNNFDDNYFASCSSLPSSSIDQEIESVLFSDAASFVSSTAHTNDLFLTQSDDLFSEIESTLLTSDDYNPFITVNSSSNRLVKLDNPSNHYDNLSLNRVSSSKRSSTIHKKDDPYKEFLAKIASNGNTMIFHLLSLFSFSFSFIPL